jgi:acetylornithine deacetylase/succinyl-diaminopimelate desuccinylase-like protein
MEMRSLFDSKVEAAMSLFKKALQEIQERRCIRICFEEGIGSAPVIFEVRMVERIRIACEHLHIAYREMASGAGHDASHMASLAPTGMVFIPSKNGRSHCPEEWSEFEHIGLGTVVLAETINLIDREGNH